jgi:Tfp pilus assembly protein PilF
LDFKASRLGIGGRFHASGDLQAPTCHMKRLLDHTLRGYGQLLAVNNRITGACVLIGLFILSVETALMSLGGALLISALSSWRAQNDTVIKTGLISVNGALLGALWLLFPQVPLWAQALATALGCAGMAFFFVPLAERRHAKKSPYVLFSLPYVATAWTAITALIFLGVHDAELTRGWSALHTSRFEKAEKHFLNTEVSTDMAEAYRCAGLGWSLYRRGDQPGAQTAFSRALSLKTGIADAYDGLGWSRFRQGRVAEACLAFQRAVALDSFLADSWVGLGWCAMQEQKPEEARRHFTTAALCAPLSADAYTGLAATLPPGRSWMLAKMWSQRIGGLSLSAQSTSSRILLCWLWFFIGILWHSRTSALMALGAIATCIQGAEWLPAFSDPAFFMNMVVLFIALGGHYLRHNFETLLWMIGLSFALGLLWGPLREGLLHLALLPLCLPFNLALLGSLAFFGWLHRQGFRDQRIPLDLAGLTPAAIRLALAQREAALGLPRHPTTTLPATASLKPAAEC